MGVEENKYNLAERIASAIDYVIAQYGVDGMLGGTFLVDKSFNPGFVPGKVGPSKQHPIVAYPVDFPEAEGFGVLHRVNPHMTVDLLAVAIARKFLDESPEDDAQANPGSGVAVQQPQATGCFSAVVFFMAAPPLFAQWLSA